MKPNPNIKNDPTLVLSSSSSSISSNQATDSPSPIFRSSFWCPPKLTNIHEFALKTILFATQIVIKRVLVSLRFRSREGEHTKHGCKEEEAWRLVDSEGRLQEGLSHAQKPFWRFLKTCHRWSLLEKIWIVKWKDLSFVEEKDDKQSLACSEGKERNQRLWLW